MCARLRQHVVGCVTADHHAARGRFYAIGGVTGDVGRSDRADLHIAKRPNDLRVFRCLEGDQVGQFRRSATLRRLITHRRPTIIRPDGDTGQFGELADAEDRWMSTRNVSPLIPVSDGSRYRRP